MNSFAKTSICFSVIATFGAACGGGQSGDLGSGGSNGDEPTGSLQFALTEADCDHLLGAKVGFVRPTNGGWPFDKIVLTVYKYDANANPTRGDQVGNAVTLNRDDTVPASSTGSIKTYCNTAASRLLPLHTFSLAADKTYQVVGEILKRKPTTPVTYKALNDVSKSTKEFDIEADETSDADLEFVKKPAGSNGNVSIKATVGAWTTVAASTTPTTSAASTTPTTSAASTTPTTSAAIRPSTSTASTH